MARSFSSCSTRPFSTDSCCSAVRSAFSAFSRAARISVCRASASVFSFSASAAFSYFMPARSSSTAARSAERVLCAAAFSFCASARGSSMAESCFSSDGICSARASQRAAFCSSRAISRSLSEHRRAAAAFSDTRSMKPLLAPNSFSFCFSASVRAVSQAVFALPEAALASFTFFCAALALFSASFTAFSSGASGARCAGRGWFSAPQTGQGSPSRSEDANTPACSSLNLRRSSCALPESRSSTLHASV